MCMPELGCRPFPLLMTARSRSTPTFPFVSSHMDLSLKPDATYKADTNGLQTEVIRNIIANKWSCYKKTFPLITPVVFFR